MTFLITNIEHSPVNKNFHLAKEVGGNKIFISGEAKIKEDKDLFVLVYGYVVMRGESNNLSLGIDTLLYLYRKYGVRFTDYIKGIFTILIVENEVLHLINDHFGLSSFYFFQKDVDYCFSDSIKAIDNLECPFELDTESLAINSLLHRVDPGYTIFKEVRKALPASHISITKNGITEEQYWNHENLLLSLNQKDSSFSFTYFADLFRKNFNNFQSQLKPVSHSITLTGGKDSRTGLAALKANNIRPFGFTYGNPLSRDAVYAKRLAESLKIPHYIFSPPDNEEYFQNISDEILGYGHPDISLHRAHRLYAFKKMSEVLEDSSAYYAGYMAGEFLMGIYYDDLIFTNFLTGFWDSSIRMPMEPTFNNYFLRKDVIDKVKVAERLSYLSTFNPSLNLKERQFYGMFEIGIAHHSQDIFLAQKYFNFIYPFFIDIDFLESLFRSEYSFFYTDNKAVNLLNRYKLFEFNLNIQHILFPEMDHIPFGKRGSYNTKEFLNGKLYWTIAKTLRYLVQRQKYPVTYSYGQPFISFLIKLLNELNADKNHALHTFFDVSLALSALKEMNGDFGEGAMRKFSNIVHLYLLMNNSKG